MGENATLAAADFYPAAAAQDWVHRAWHAAPCADGADALASGCVVAEFPALGLRPSKDTFWTTSNSSKRAYAPGANPGTNVELNAIVAATSTGPVGIGDAAGETQGSKRERNSQLQRLRSRPFSTRFG